MLEVSNTNYLDDVGKSEYDVIRWEADTPAEGLAVHEDLIPILNLPRNTRFTHRSGRPYKCGSLPDDSAGLRHDIWNNVGYCTSNATREIVTHWVRVPNGRVRGATEFTGVIWSRQTAHTLPERYLYADYRLTADGDDVKTKIKKRVLGSSSGTGSRALRYRYIQACVDVPEYGLVAIDADYVNDYGNVHCHNLIAEYYLSLPFQTYEALLRGEYKAWGSLPPAADEETQKTIDEISRGILARIATGMSRNI